MANIFDKFDKQVNMAQLSEDVKAAAAQSGGSYEEVPAGEYSAVIEHMELGQTKDGRPMFKVQMRLKSGADPETQEFVSKYKKGPCVFMNRVVFGTKNDANMISSVIGWLNSTQIYEEPVTFEGYADLADLILDMAEDAQGLVFDIAYDPDLFNTIDILNTYEA